MPFPCLRRGCEGAWLGGSRSYCCSWRGWESCRCCPLCPTPGPEVEQIVFFKKEKQQEKTPRFGVKDGFTSVPVLGHRREWLGRAGELGLRSGAGQQCEGSAWWLDTSAVPSGAGGGSEDASEGVAAAAAVIAGGRCAAPRKPRPRGPATRVLLPGGRGTALLFEV